MQCNTKNGFHFSHSKFPIYQNILPLVIYITEVFQVNISIFHPITETYISSLSMNLKTFES